MKRDVIAELPVYPPRRTGKLSVDEAKSTIILYLEGVTGVSAELEYDKRDKLYDVRIVRAGFTALPASGLTSCAAERILIAANQSKNAAFATAEETLRRFLSLEGGQLHLARTRRLHRMQVTPVPVQSWRGNWTEDKQYITDGIQCISRERLRRPSYAKRDVSRPEVSSEEMQKAVRFIFTDAVREGAFTGWGWGTCSAVAHYVPADGGAVLYADASRIRLCEEAVGAWHLPWTCGSADGMPAFALRTASGEFVAGVMGLRHNLRKLDETLLGDIFTREELEFVEPE